MRRRGTRNSFCEYQPIYFRRIRHPSKHDTLNHCWFDVGPASATLGQHQTNIGSTYRVHWDVDWRWRSDFPPCIVTGFAHNKWISGGSRNWEEKGLRCFTIWQVLLVWFRSRGVLKCSHWLNVINWSFETSLPPPPPQDLSDFMICITWFRIFLH